MRAQVSSIELDGVINLAVLAPIRAGLVDGFESITYLERLDRLLKALQAARQNARESELRKPAFPDSIGRLGIIRSFRYAVVPPAASATASPGFDEPGLSRLSLNVSFDGGWEPYMRVIYRDIGTLLDALFCHCDGYPGSRSSSFDRYCRWVRNHEIGKGLFFVDSSVTSTDQRYLAEVERLQRESGNAADADRAIAGFALPTDVQQLALSLQTVVADPPGALALSLRTLKGLYRLSAYFPKNAGDDAGVLRRFAHSALQDFADTLERPELAALSKQLQRLLPDEMAWFRQPVVPAPVKDRLSFTAAALQDAILNRNDAVTHGCVVMLGVRDAAKAAAHLADLAARCAAPADPAAVRVQVAFTHGGLVALGIDAQRLDALPQEFVEGMEARCGLLGDLRGNHPDRWLRPLRAGGAAGARIDLDAVHVVVILRLIDPHTGWVEPHPRLAPAIAALHAADTGLALLALQPTRSWRNAQGRTVEHFGFVDGLSQPVVQQRAAAPPGGDVVRPGELVLGYANDRGDGPFPERADDLLDNASFMVMRKLRQRVDHLHAALPDPTTRDAVLAKMMGRAQDGTAPVPLRGSSGGENDFDYMNDPQGAACPFHSHIRRTNPRDGRRYVPRLLRRGMSYGPRSTEAGIEADRGIVFMAYCASIAEQFETVQRWIAGGNSSGVSSAQADPFLAVPQPGERRTFRYIDAAGRVARVDLHEKPFAELQWGLYLFVPSLKALLGLATFRSAAAAPASAVAPPAAASDALETWRNRLEDKARKDDVWALVRRQPQATMPAAPYGTLIGDAPGVLRVLQDNGQRYSVAGQGRRMSASIGVNFLGLDPADGHDEQAPNVNAVIESIDERAAFDAAMPIVEATLQVFIATLKQPDPSGPVRVPIDLVSFSERVLAGLCTLWFGLPEDPGTLGEDEQPFMITGGRLEEARGPARCPGHLLSPSRFIFAPRPRACVADSAQAQGTAALSAVRRWFQSGRRRGPLTDQIVAGLHHIDAGRRQDVIERTLAGMLLGFPPTVHGNFLRTMETWIDDKLLWACQQQLADGSSAPGTAFDHAESALRKTLMATMRRRPVPEMLWRSPVVKGAVAFADDERIVLGIASALTDPQVPDELMFGGSRDAGSAFHTVHACPGYHMGVGVLLALLAGLLDAGTLRPTGSPVLLMLTPDAP